MNRKINECGIILVKNTFDHILIIFQNQSLKWGLPKGHLLENELMSRAYFDCAKRELLEETGIMLTTHKYKKLGTVCVKDKLFYLIYLPKKIMLRKPIDREEIGGMKWLPILSFQHFVDTFNCNITLKEYNKYIPIISESHHRISNAQMV